MITFSVQDQSEPLIKSSKLEFNKLNPIMEEKQEKILCEHCKRTASNGISCRGMCVADNEY